MTLFEIKTEVDRLAALIGASEYDLPTYGHSEDGARPHLEIDAHGYHYAVVERGQELERITTQDLDELLFNIFAKVAFSLACRYELTHRIEGQDFRRILFRQQVALLAKLSLRWSERERERQERTLQTHPFTDDLDG